MTDTRITGQCHCGAVRFRVALPSRQVELLDCNCSICARTGYLHLIVPHGNFTLLTPREALATYRFGTGAAEHLFCATCGVKSFYQPRSHPECWSVNFRCIDEGHGLDATLRAFDGRDWDAAQACGELESDATGKRHREVLGDGPRIAPLRPDELTADALRVHDLIRAVANRDLERKTLENLPEIIGTLLRHPQLFEKQTEVGLQLLANGTLPPRDRELAILRIAWLCQAPYEFGEHVILARGVGIDSSEVEAVIAGSTAPRWTPDERALLRAVEELYDNAMICDETWGLLAARYDQRQLIELPVLVGQYQQTAYLQNALRLALHEGNDGLDAR